MGHAQNFDKQIIVAIGFIGEILHGWQEKFYAFIKFVTLFTVKHSCYMHM